MLNGRVEIAPGGSGVVQLIGLRITGGWYTGDGGGVHVASGTVTFESCLIYGNEAPNYFWGWGWGGGNGGGVFVDGGIVAFRGCEIYGNTAGSWGGGVFVDGGTVSFSSCVIHSNSAPTGPNLYVTGGIVCTWATTLTGVYGPISTCSASPPPPSPSPPPPSPPGHSHSPHSHSPVVQTICTNTCQYASDGSCSDGGPGAEFANCAYGEDCLDCGPRPTSVSLSCNAQVCSLTSALANTAVRHILLASGTYSLSAKITRNVVLEAAAGASVVLNGRVEIAPGWSGVVQLIGLRITGGWYTGDGGGVHVASGTVTFESCLIYGNEAPNYFWGWGWGGGNGGGVFVDGGIVAFRGCEIYGNTAGSWGGGVFVDGGTVSFSSCVIHSNSAPTGPNLYVTGGIVCTWATTLTGFYGPISTCSAPPPPPSPPPPSPSPPPPSPPGHSHSPPSHSPHSHSPVAQNTYFTITSGPCTVDPSSPNCIRSPNFPSNYGNSEACSITPTALAIGRPLTATSFDTESGYDFLFIPSHPSGTLTAFYGGGGPSNFILGPGTIQWTTDSSVTYTGWRVCRYPSLWPPSPPPLPLYPPGGAPLPSSPPPPSPSRPPPPSPLPPAPLPPPPPSPWPPAPSPPPPSPPHSHSPHSHSPSVETSVTSAALAAVETSDATGVIIGVIVGVIIALALALVILHRRRLDMRRKKAHGPHPLQRPTPEAHEPPPSVATAVPKLKPSEGSVVTGIELGELTKAEAPEKAPPVPVPVNVNLGINVSVNVPAKLEAQSQSVLVPRLPDLTLPVAMAAANVIPTLELRYAIGSRVYVKRSNGEETVAFVQEYDAEKALYTVELGRLGSRKAKTCRDKDLRAVDVVEGLLYSARAAIFSPFQAAQEPEPAEEAAQAEAAQAEAVKVAAEEAAQAAEVARAATEEEEAQAPEAARVQVMEPIVPPTAVRTVDELRNRRSTFNFPRHVVPPAAFANVRDVTRGQDSVRL